MTNYEWLLNMGSEERQAWFDAQHVDANDALSAENDVRADGVCANDVDVSQDSREKLLADLEKQVRVWHDYDGNFMRIYDSVAYAQVNELLDRQAAITERELCKQCDWPSLAAQPDYESQGRIVALTDKVDELTAERDEWKAKAEGLTEALEKLGCSVLVNGTVFEPAPHVDANDDLPPENDVSSESVDANDGFMDLDSCTHGVRTFASETDSREKLEADIEEYLACEYGCIPGIVAVYPDWLDRQAAITRATESHGWRMAASGPIYEYRQERDRLQAKLDEVEAERDALARDLAECDENRIELKERCERAEKALVEMERERDYWELHTDCWADKCSAAEETIGKLREKLSRACDNAHDTLRMMDEGLA